MPDFHLSEEETKSLASYIERSSKGTIPAFDKTPSGKPEQGRKLFAELRCDRCHQISGSEKLAQPDVRSAFVSDANRGCLDDKNERSRKAPTYHWTERQRQSLAVYVTTKAKKGASAAERSEVPVSHLLASLRCAACHARDASSAVWPEIVAEEGSGKLPEAVPQLTWVGEKLQGPWVAKLIKGELKEKPRPWIAARMPSFPVYADVIAHGLAREHGIAFDEPLPTKLNAEQIEIGQRLTRRDGGLDCRQCHGVGNDLPKGDAGTQIALGINFMMTRDRVRPEFALRQMLDPPRYDIGSRMPKFAADLKTTAAKQIEGGDALKQFEALKQYLWSLKEKD